MTEPIVLVGGGGHCKACIDVIEAAKFSIGGIVDKQEKTNWYRNYQIIGNDQDLEVLVLKKNLFLITVGQIKTAQVRIQLYTQIKEYGGRFATVVAPTAVVSPTGKVGEGTIVMHHAIINADATVGINGIINNKALVEHDSVVGDHCHVSTAATVNGGCTIGNSVFIGSNAVIAQGVTITDNVIVGAGAVVVKNITEPGMYVGNPARKLSA